MRTHGQLRKPQHTYLKRMNRAFKVIQGHPYWPQRNSASAAQMKGG